MLLSAFHCWEKISHRIIVKEERLMDPKVDGLKVSFCGGWAPLVGSVAAVLGGSGGGESVHFVNRM